jgi:hypothetical protein
MCGSAKDSMLEFLGVNTCSWTVREFISNQYTTKYNDGHMALHAGRTDTSQNETY